jgi:NADH-quinone oxidoreductase subunit H
LEILFLLLFIIIYYYFIFIILFLFSIFLKKFYNIFIFFFFKFLPLIILILLAVAFFTLFERKLLASVQRRRGPNVIGIFGLLQPIADGFKLLSKETVVPYSSNFFIFLISPLVTFVLALFSWGVIPFF